MRASAALAVVAAAALVAAAGCGGSGAYGSGSSGSSSGSGGGAAAKVSEKEFSISDPGTVKAGKVTFTASNDGSVDHVLEIDGPGVQGKATGTIAPGKSAKVTVTLEQGAYTLTCPVDGHTGLGMKLAVKVR